MKQKYTAHFLQSNFISKMVLKIQILLQKLRDWNWKGKRFKSNIAASCRLQQTKQTDKWRTGREPNYMCRAAVTSAGIIVIRVKLFLVDDSGGKQRTYFLSAPKEGVLRNVWIYEPRGETRDKSPPPRWHLVALARPAHLAPMRCKPLTECRVAHMHCRSTHQVCEDLRLRVAEPFSPQSSETRPARLPTERVELAELVTATPLARANRSRDPRGELVPLGLLVSQTEIAVPTESCCRQLRRGEKEQLNPPPWSPAPPSSTIFFPLLSPPLLFVPRTSMPVVTVSSK